MATNYPATLQDLDATRGSATDKLDSPSHSAHHALEDDTLEALQAKLGVDSSAVVTSIDYLLKNTTGGHDHDGVDSKKIIISNLDVTGLTASDLLRVNSGGNAIEASGLQVANVVTLTGSQVLTNKTLTSPIINTPTITGGNLPLPFSGLDTSVGSEALSISNLGHVVISDGTAKTLTLPAVSVAQVGQGMRIYAQSATTTVTRAASDVLYQYGTGVNPNSETSIVLPPFSGVEIWKYAAGIWFYRIYPADDGWTPVTETWTYASASTITVPTGAASRYKIGDKIKWTQTTVKYGVIVAVADTLLTIQVNTDYTVANAAISANYYSHEANPIGFPNWFALAAPTFNVAFFDNGSAGQPTTTEHRISFNGRTVTVHYKGTGVKAGTDVFLVQTANPMPIPVNSTVPIGLGSGIVNSGSAPFLGVFVYDNVNPYAFIMQAAMTDNVTIVSFSYTITYEI